mmetsp:Transcript_16855/g.39149  ORF Transcript_16855/g.39149 Transcript_16855/m.39149 type:complete len:294 (-) Transcript_16855:17-898(-)
MPRHDAIARTRRHFAGAVGNRWIVVAVLVFSWVIPGDVPLSLPATPSTSTRDVPSVAVPSNDTADGKDPLVLDVAIAGYLDGHPRAVVKQFQGRKQTEVTNVITVWRPEDITFLNRVNPQQLRVQYWRSMRPRDRRRLEVRVKVLTDSIRLAGRRKSWLLLFDATISLHRRTLIPKCAESWRNATLRVDAEGQAPRVEEVRALQLRCPLKPRGFLGELGITPPLAEEGQHTSPKLWARFTFEVFVRVVCWSLRVTVVLASVLIPARLKCVTLVMLVFTACLPIILSRLQDDSS